MNSELATAEYHKRTALVDREESVRIVRRQPHHYFLKRIGPRRVIRLKPPVV